jgi:hypothetical protein
MHEREEETLAAINAAMQTNTNIQILKRLEDIMSALTDLAAAVAANTTATNAAVSALGSAGGSSDTAAIEAAVAQLTTNNNALTAAVGVTAPGGPVVTGVSPSTVAIAGGTSLTVTGSGFTGTQAVNFDGVKGSSGTVVNDTQITVVSPPLAAGVHDVTVSTAAATSATSPADQVTAA